MLGLDFFKGDIHNVCELGVSRIRSGERTICTPVNVDVYMTAIKNPRLMSFIKSSDIISADGMPIVWLSHFLKDKVIRITGADLMPELCLLASKENLKTFVLGGMEEANNIAVENIIKEFGIQCKGYSPVKGFENDKVELGKIMDQINEFKPDILFVCLGAPKQEFWIEEHHQKANPMFILSCGAAVDFMARTVKRAPDFMQKTGFEWLYRLACEPKRLFSRYILKDLFFFRYFITEIIYKWGGKQ